MLVISFILLSRIEFDSSSSHFPLFDTMSLNIWHRYSINWDIATSDSSHYFFSQIHEDFIYILSSFGWGIEIRKVVLCGRFTDRYTRRFEVVFVSDDDNLCFLVGVVLDFWEPAFHSFGGFGFGEVVDQNDPNCIFVVSSCYCSKRLLSSLHYPWFEYCIPDLKFDGFSGHMDFLCGELDSHGRIVIRIEALLDKHRQESAFPHRSVSDQDELEDVVKL